MSVLRHTFFFWGGGGGGGGGNKKQKQCSDRMQCTMMKNENIKYTNIQ